MKKLVLLYFVVSALLSCQSDKEFQKSLADNQALNRDIIGKKLVFSPELSCINTNQKISTSKPILLTALSTDCGECIEILMRWNNYPNLDALSDYQIIFVAMGKENDVISNYLQLEDKKRFNIVLDTAGNFLRDNQLYAYYQKTIALDKNHRVKYIGDPTKNKHTHDDLIYLENEL